MHVRILVLLPGVLLILGSQVFAEKLFDERFVEREIKKGDTAQVSTLDLKEKEKNVIKYFLEQPSVKRLKKVKIKINALDSERVEIDGFDSRTIVLGKKEYAKNDGDFSHWHSTTTDLNDPELYAVGGLTVSADGKRISGTVEFGNRGKNTTIYFITPLDEDGESHLLVERVKTGGPL
jgi:hypothetical protein